MFKKTTFLALAITLLLGGPALAAQSVVIAPYDWTFLVIPDVVPGGIELSPDLAPSAYNASPPANWMYVSVRDSSKASSADIIMWPNDAEQKSAAMSSDG